MYLLPELHNEENLKNKQKQTQINRIMEVFKNKCHTTS